MQELETILEDIPKFYIESVWDHIEHLKSSGKCDKIPDQAKESNYVMSRFTTLSEYNLYLFCNCKENMINQGLENLNDTKFTTGGL